MTEITESVDTTGLPDAGARRLPWHCPSTKWAANQNREIILRFARPGTWRATMSASVLMNREPGDLFRALERRQIFDNRADIFRRYRGLVIVHHLVDFRGPGLLRQLGLVQHHVGRVTGEAVVVDRVGAGAIGKHLVAVRQVDLHRLELHGRSSTPEQGDR